MKTRINFNTLRSEECNLKTQYRIIAPFYTMLTMLLLRSTTLQQACDLCQSGAIQTKAYVEDQKMDSYFRIALQ